MFPSQEGPSKASDQDCKPEKGLRCQRDWERQEGQPWSLGLALPPSYLDIQQCRDPGLPPSIMLVLELIL